MLAALCMAGTLATAGEAAKTTLDNLQTAYAGEAGAGARYEAFRRQADEEGYKSVAALFRAAAKSKGLRAAKSEAAIKALGGTAKAPEAKPEVKSTKENLEAAVTEKAAKEAAYPAFIKQAETDKNDKAVMVFKGDVGIEASLTPLFEQALKELDNWKAAGKEFLVCQVCAYVTSDSAIKQCPVCSAPRSKFDVVK
jgi:rubrerythrin